MTDEQAALVEGQAAPKGWTDGMPEDLRGFIENKGFKDSTALAGSYMNLEKLRGVPEARLLKLPEKMDEPGAMDSVFDRLGRPEAADKYTRALSDEFNDDVFKGIAAEAHKLGLSDGQFAGLQKITGSLAQQLAEKQDADAAAAFDGWKKENPDGFQGAARVMAGLGVDEDHLAGILAGDKVSLYGFLAKVSARSQETPVIQGEQPGGAFNMSPEGAKAKIEELFADKDFMAQFTSRNVAIRQPAIDRMMKLQEAVSKRASK